jgi:hypothetical protein
MMAGDRGFVVVDVRSASLDRPAWAVEVTRAADQVGGFAIVPGDTEHEAIARAAHLAIAGGFVKEAGELREVRAVPFGLPVGVIAVMADQVLAARGLSAVPGCLPAPEQPAGFVVPMPARSKAVH